MRGAGPGGMTGHWTGQRLTFIVEFHPMTFQSLEMKRENLCSSARKPEDVGRLLPAMQIVIHLTNSCNPTGFCFNHIRT